ncbi:hypothetical protein [Salinicola peritrichatus]|uniref:hypothetical protein n=1 Tax=Salinicola peritrichatus TaxID=1267424 RepID=UPI000DA18F9E|nr:hypothetical protein [Salinicola peritrichatus]
MSNQNRKRIIIQAGESSLMYPTAKVPSYDDLGLVSVGDDTGRLLRNKRSGTYVMYIGGATRSLDQRKVRSALGIGPGRPEQMQGGRRRNVYMSDADADYLRQIGNGNLSEGIRVAVAAHREQ